MKRWMALPFVSLALIGGAPSVSVIISPASGQSIETDATRTTPSYDCKRAQDIAEKLICEYDDLAQLDQDIAVAYAAALKRLDAKGDAALHQEQEWFNYLRIGIADPNYAFDDASPHDRLKGLIESRRDFLLSIRKPTHDPTNMRLAAIGRWQNYFGLIEIKPLTKRRGSVSATAADPYSARWICEFAGDGNYINETLVIERRPSGGTRLNFMPDGDVLVVTEHFKKGESITPYCGYRGTLTGSYFFTKTK